LEGQTTLTSDGAPGNSDCVLVPVAIEEANHVIRVNWLTSSRFDVRFPQPSSGSSVPSTEWTGHHLSAAGPEVLLGDHAIVVSTGDSTLWTGRLTVTVVDPLNGQVAVSLSTD
jgi:hypothetical protein